MISVLEFTSKAGLDEAISPGEVKYRPIIGEKEGTSYTLKYDHKDPNRLRMEVIPGLTGKALEAKELHSYAVWLQSPSQVDLQVQSGSVTDARGTLLGKKVAGEEVLEKIQDFFGALANHAVSKALELAITAANIAKQILPSLGTVPFANEFTGRSLAFAKAASPRQQQAVTPKVAAGPAAPSLGLGGSGSARAIQTHRAEDGES